MLTPGVQLRLGASFTNHIGGTFKPCGQTAITYFRIATSSCAACRFYNYGNLVVDVPSAYSFITSASFDHYGSIQLLNNAKFEMETGSNFIQYYGTTQLGLGSSLRTNIFDMRGGSLLGYGKIHFQIFKK